MSDNDLDQLRAAVAAAEEIRQLRQQVAELEAVNSDWMAQTNEALSRAEVAEQSLATERAKAGELRRVLLKHREGYSNLVELNILPWGAHCETARKLVEMADKVLDRTSEQAGERQKAEREVIEAAQAISDAFGPIETIPLPGLDAIGYGPAAGPVKAELIVKLREKLAALAGEEQR